MTMELDPRTNVNNKTQNAESRKSRQRALTWLAQTFPEAFNVEGTIRPLKIGIFDDILAHAEKNGGLPFSKAKLREALVVFTRRMDYLACVKMRDVRVDLAGNDAVQVTEEAAKQAAQKIKKSIEKNIRARRKAAAAARAERSERLGARGRNSGHYRRRFTDSPQHSHPQYNSPYSHDEESYSPSAATIRVKRRYAPVKNYNSENYNTSETVDRLKAKLGIKTRRERFEYED